MRVNVQDAPGHPDNRGIVVSHVGLNVDRLWDDFKRIDEDDQRLIHAWLISAEQTPPATAGDGVRRTLRPEMVVNGELTLDHFLGDKFLEIPEEDRPARALEVLRSQGIDPASLGLNEEMLALLRDNRPPSEPTGPVEQPVQPQLRRQSLQRRLDEQERTLAMRICQTLGLNPNGRKFAPRSGTGASSDYQAMIITVHRAVNTFLGIAPGERPELTMPELETVLPELDSIGDAVQDDVATKVA